MKRLLVFLGLFLIPSLALAGSISITTTVSGEFMSDNISYVNVSLLNSGDETAYDVQITPLLPNGFESRPVYVGNLVPNIPFKTNFSILRTEDVLEGKYSMVVRVEYSDANGYPFSSVSPASLVYKNPSFANIVSSISRVSIPEKGSRKVTLSLQNLDDISHDLKTKLFLPKELRSEVLQKNIIISPKQEKKIEFIVTSLSALTGSNYVILALAEYEENNFHYSSFATGMVNIIEKKNIFNLSSWIPVVIVVVLITIFIFYQVKGKHIRIKIVRDKKL